ncbi:hypothetical protein [Amycolatopsis samaneae]|uniref:Uncharacterized protein n=1 Tax=Amycolatopsis samaneae TaxID=664691 RepID=A0ABW5GMV2_9PSEU
MGSDKLALGISALSAVFAFASLCVSALSYRRGRPRVSVKDAGAVTKVFSQFSAPERRGQDALIIYARLVNRGQAPVQMAVQPLVAEFARSRFARSWKRRWPYRRGWPPTDRTGIFAPLEAQTAGREIGGFEGVEVSASLPDELLNRAEDGWLERTRLRITLSSGDVIVSRWFDTPSQFDHLIEHRRAELRRDADAAMRDLARVIEQSPGALARSVIRKTGMRSDVFHDHVTLREVNERFRRQPTWPAIAKIVKALDESGGVQRLELWKKRWAETLAVATTDDELRTERRAKRLR